MRQIGRYEVLRELGRGAMGIVFKARDPFIGRAVAVKTITGVVAENADLLERFYREAKAAGGLQHPNIVTVYEMAESDGFPFIAMEYLEGESLEKLIARRPPLPLAQKLGYIVQAGRALDYSHRRGVVHRDIKPANMVVTLEGVVKVVDFGIARIAETSNTQTGALLGTLGYMSPEQLRGKHADERCDIWSLGVVLYELLCYERPFSGDNHGALMMSILQDEPRPIGERLPECPAELGTIVHRTLHKQDAGRYQTMEELLRDLEPIWTALQRETVQQMVHEGRQMMENGKLAEGLLLEARVEVESALKLDPQDSAARTFYERVQLQEGRATQSSSEQQQFIARQIRSMRSAIDRGELSNAIQLGKETLAQVGEDSQMTQLIEFAEKEREFRATKQDLDRRIREIAGALAQGQFDEARMQVETLQTTAPLDPRLVKLLEAASERRPLSTASAASILGQPAGDRAGTAREYVYESGASQKSFLDGPAETLRRPSPPLPLRTSSSSAPTPPATSFPNASSPSRAETTSGTLPQASPNARFTLSTSGMRTIVYLAGGIFLLLAGFIGYQEFAAPRRLAEVKPGASLPAPPPSAPAPLASATQPIPSPPGSLEDQQRRLIDLAHQAADSKDYKAAQARLEEAIKLNGPLNSMAQDLRVRFSQEAHGVAVQHVAGQEKTLWAQAMNDLDAGKLDDAETQLRKILILPEGGRHRADAEQYVDQAIPIRREQDQLWADALQASQLKGPGHLIELRKILDQLLPKGGPHEHEAQQLLSSTLQQFARANAKKNNLPPPVASVSDRGQFLQLEEQFAQAVQLGNAQALEQLQQLRPKFKVFAEGGSLFVGNARDYMNVLIPKAQEQIEARLAYAESNAKANTEFEKAVQDYDQAVAAQDVAALRSRILREFQQIAQSGGPRAREASQFVSVLIPSALKGASH